MNNIEDQLNKLPQAKLSRKTDLFLRFTFWKLSWQNYFNDLCSVFIVKRLAPVALIVFLILLVGLPYYAYASDDVVRGNILYPLKQGVENIELNLASTPEKKVAVLTKLANRRLAEVNKLSQQVGAQVDNDLAQTINQMVFLTNQADKDASSTLLAEQKPAIKNNLESIKHQQLASVEDIARGRGLKASDQLLDSVALAIENLKKERTKQQNLSASLPAAPKAASTMIRGLFGSDRANIASTVIGISTTTEKKMNKNKTKFNQEITAESLANVKERINNLKDNLAEEGATPDDTKNLFERLDDRLNKAQSAIDSGNFNQAQGLIKSTDAISNNARHFLRFTERASSTPENWVQKNDGNIGNGIKRGQQNKHR